MASGTLPGGTFTMAGDLTVTRMGYGAMQLAGPRVFGPPRDRAAAVTVLREAAQLGITHIDTSDYYGPYVTNQIIKEALYPYPDGLHIVTKVGALRDAEGGWPSALAPEQLRQAVHDNLDHLGLDVLDIVNLRVGGFDSPEPGSIAGSFSVLARPAAARADQAPRYQHRLAPIRLPKHSPSRRSRACRISTTSPTGPMTTSSTLLPRRASPMCPTSRSAASPRCSPAR